MSKIILITILVGVAILSLQPQSLHSQTLMDERSLIAYLRGTFYEARGNYPEAYQWYSYSSNREPQCKRIKLSLARISLELGYLDKARSYSTDVLTDKRYEAEASMILAQVEYLEGNKEKALGLLENLRSRNDVPRFEILKFLSRIYLEMGRIDDAQKTLEEAKAIFPEDLYVNYRLGVIYTRAGDLDRAIESFRKVVEISPDFSGAQLALASILDHVGKKDEAELYYKSVLKLDPGNTDALNALSQLYLEEGEFEKGIELLRPLFRQGKLDDRGEVNYGRFLYEAGKLDGALNIFKRILDEQGEKPAVLRVIAEIEVSRKHYKTAYGYLKRLIDLEPDNFSNYMGLLLVAYNVAGEPASKDEAVSVSDEERRRYLEKASKLVSNDSFDGNYLFGVIYSDLKEYDKAERYLRRAERLKPDDRGNLLELASLYEKRGMYGEAIERLKKLWEAFPDDPTIANFYGYVLAEKGEELDFAERLLKKALSKEPENGYFLDSLGWILFRKKNYREAAKTLKRAIEKAGDDAVIWEHLGDAYLKLGERTKAISAYDRSLKANPSNDKLKEKVKSLKGR